MKSLNRLLKLPLVAALAAGLAASPVAFDPAPRINQAHAANPAIDPSILGRCYLKDYDPLFFTKSQSEQGAQFQRWLLSCQKQAIAYGANTFASLARNSCVEAIPTSTRFAVNFSTTIVVPRYVCLNATGSTFVRDGTTGVAAPNWTGDPYASNLANLFQPYFIFVPTASLTGDLKLILNRTGSDRGSGVFYGRMWRIRTLAIAPGGGGTGFVGGESCTVRVGDFASPAAGATFTVASASGGAATALNYAPIRWAAQTGQYPLPPYWQQYQWSIGNGWNGTDVLRPQVFDGTNYTGNLNNTATVTNLSTMAGLAQGQGVSGPGIPVGTTIAAVGADSITLSNPTTSTATNATITVSNFYYKTTCGGVDKGLLVVPTWWPDWCDGSNGCAASTAYDGIFSNFTPATAYLHNIYAVQSGNSTSASYGDMYGVTIAAADLDSNLIQTGNSRRGTVIYGTDARFNTINDVNSWNGLQIIGGGSVQIDKYVGDTSLDHYLEIDRIGNLAIKGNFLNTGASLTGAASILIGTNTTYSGPTSQSRNVTLDIQMENGGSTAGVPALFCQYMRGSNIKLTVTNLNGAGNPFTYQNNRFVQFGSNCEASNLFTGSIDNVAGSITTGSDLGVGMNVWDGQAKGFAGPGGTYRLTGSGAPANGGAGTGANKAGRGSIYTDLSTGQQYTQTTAASSPTWGAVGGGGQKFVFQLPGTQTVGADKTNWAIAVASGQLGKAWAVAKTGPTGSALIFDVLKSSNNGSSFTSIWNATPANRLQIAPGSNNGSQTSFDAPSFNAGDIFRIDVSQIGSGAAGADVTTALSAQ